MRPAFAEVTIPAFSRTPRCWTTVGSAISNGRASSLTDAGERDSRSTMARRLLSASAWNVWSKAKYLGTYLRIEDAAAVVKAADAGFSARGSQPAPDRWGPNQYRSPEPARGIGSRVVSAMPSRQPGGGAMRRQGPAAAPL